MLNYCLVKLLELQNLLHCCMKKILKIVDGRKICRLSHLFPEAEKRVVSVKGQHTSQHPSCLALSWKGMTEGGPLLQTAHAVVNVNRVTFNYVGKKVEVYTVPVYYTYLHFYPNISHFYSLV